MRPHRPAVAIVCVVMLMSAGDLAASDRDPSGPPGLAELRGLDRLRLTDMDGRTWTAEDFQDRVILIDFWATWCAPCLSDLPYLKKARARHAREGFEILGVSFDVSDRRTFVSWLNRQRVDWPQVFDGRGRQGTAARQLQVIAVPTSFLIDRQGRLIAMNLRGERLLAAIDAAVAEK